MDDRGNYLPGSAGDNEDEPVRRISDTDIFRRVSPTMQDGPPEQNVSDEYEEAVSSEPSPEGEEVERQLAHYAFVREEREREVRLVFRDVPADEVAAAFRAAGASLITLAAERAATAPPPEAPIKEQTDEPPPKRRRKRAGSQPPGALSMRYFYALGETVYTITITLSSEVIPSVAPIFPAAALSERELHKRMAVVFHRPETDLRD